MRTYIITCLLLTASLFSFAQERSGTLSFMIKPGVNTHLDIFSGAAPAYPVFGHKTSTTFGISYKTNRMKNWGLEFELLYNDKGNRFHSNRYFPEPQIEYLSESFEPNILLPISIIRRSKRFYWSFGPTIQYNFKGYYYDGLNRNLISIDYPSFFSHFNPGVQLKFGRRAIDTNNFSIDVEPFIHHGLDIWNNYNTTTTFGIGIGIGKRIVR